MALDSKQIDRIGVYLLVAAGAVILVGGLFQIRSYIYATERGVFIPFREQLLADLDSGLIDEEAYFSTSEAERLGELQGTDTDGDGLSDYDEEYLYGTSAYLADSDSDGISDGDEVLEQSDPNCPAGSDCQQERTGGDGTITAAEEAFAELNPGAAEAADLVSSLTPDEIREMLREQGVSEDIIAQTDDETLMTLAAESAEDAARGGNARVSIQNEADNIKNLSSDDKRALLLDSGLAQEEIDSIGDAQLDELVSAAVDDALNQVSSQADVTGSQVDASNAAGL